MSVDPQILEATRRIFKDMGGQNVTQGKLNEKLWNTLQEAGLTRAWCPEKHGGPGGSLADGLSIIGITGEFCDAVPLTETLLASWVLSRADLASPAGPLSLLFSEKRSGIKLDQEGLLIGEVQNVPCAMQAEHLVVLVEGDPGYEVVLIKPTDCFILPKANIAGEARDDVSVTGVKPLSIGKPDPEVTPSDLKLLGALARSIQMTKAILVVLEMCIDYSQQRPAFGRPISKFQSIQHYLATIAGEYAASVAMTGAAEESIVLANNIRSENMLQIASAKIRVGEAANKVCSLAHQIHGAIGFTEEHSLHQFTHRLWSCRNEFGTEAQWAVQLGNLVAQHGPEDIWQKLTSS